MAFVINKEMGKDTEWSDLMVIYVPNTDEEKIKFFEKLYNEMNKRVYEERMIILGDFNCVEDENIPIRV